jgi:uncharacterized Zn finger protein (UPF0148 family)
MACVRCQIETTSTLCEVCRYLVEETHLELTAACDQCGAPLTSSVEGEILCNACTAMFQAVRESRWLFRSHVEWEQENIRMARKKSELMGTGGPAFM